MIQDNASFTFLHRIEEVELNIEDGRWQLRCEYLHQNKGFANTEDNTSIRFHLGMNCGTSVCQLDRIGSDNSLTDIRIDIEQFCRRMCQAARAYYEVEHTEKDFNLYNTPVLDFIKASQDEQSNATIAIMCSNSAYGNGLKLALQRLTKIILVFETPEAAKKCLRHLNPRPPFMGGIRGSFLFHFPA